MSMDMKQYFHDLAAHVDTLAKPGEVIVSSLAAEDSDFIRFNKSAVRQAMAIRQVYWTLSLIHDKRRLDAKVTLAGSLATDRAALAALLRDLRNAIGELPQDPFLLYQTEPAQSLRESKGQLPDPASVIDSVSPPAADWTSSACMPAGRSIAASPTRWARATGTRSRTSTSAGRSTTRATRR